MGKFEDQIKTELMQNVYADLTAVYEFIENRFTLDELSRQKVIEKINNLNEELYTILKDAKLS